MMPRKAKERKPHRFDLDVNNEHEAVLHEHLLKLAEKGQASDWIIYTLLNSLPNEPSTERVQAVYPASTERVQQPVMEPEQLGEPAKPPVVSTWQRSSNGGKSPAELIRERKIAASLKFTTPKDKA